MKASFYILVSLLFFTGITIAQPPPPPAAAGGGETKPYQKPSLADSPPLEKFSSADGRFIISLPKGINGFSALTPQSVGINVTGSSYQWQLREGGILIHYFDYLDPKFSVVSEQDYVDYFAGVKDSTLNALKATLISSSEVKLNNYRGIRLDFQLANGVKGTHRNFIAGKRQYALTGFYAQNIPDAEKLINQAFDSFTLVSRKDGDEAMQRQIEQATPAMLPQEPVAKKEKSDAEDENLKGSVKKLIEEDEDLSGTFSVQGRHPTSIYEYNEKGNRVKSLLYDSKGLPFEINVYGYLDGTRASHYKIIESDSNPPIMALSAPGSKEKPKFDPRYSFKHEYQYTNGKLTQAKWIGNDGSLWIRYVYNYKENTVEELVYDKNEKLNQKYLSVLDEKGNETERTDFNVLGISRNGDQKSITKYDSFDEKGNWTKKTTYDLVTENGKQMTRPSLITYRTLTYYN